MLDYIASPSNRFHVPSLWRCTYLGEVLCLEGFNEDTLYLELVLNALPLGWMSRNGNMSMLSWKTRPNAKDVCNLSIPFEIELFHEGFMSPSWPSISIKVSAIDSFGRETCVGSGDLFLPRHPGKHDLTIQTTKNQVAMSHVDGLSQYFLGFIETDDQEPSNEKNQEMSTSSSKMTSGRVQIRVYSLMRSKESIDRQQKGRADLVASIEQVIKAFEQAKEKLKSVSKMIHVQDPIETIKQVKKEETDQEEHQEETDKEDESSEESFSSTESDSTDQLQDD